MELCIDFGGTEIKLAVISNAEILVSSSIPVSGDVSDLASAVLEARSLLTQVGGTADAVGIAVPGVVDPASDRMLHANAKYEFLQNFDLHAWADAEFGLPSIVENDARAALVGEAFLGSASGERDVVMVTLGTGIGTAALIDGVPLRGHSGHGGILGGHMTVDINGPICPCGNIGCGEVLASVRTLRENHPGLDMAEVFEGDEHAELRERYLRAWGAVVATLVLSYDPKVVVLSGGIMRAGDAVRIPIETFVRAHLWPSVPVPRFVVPPEPELSVARGLAALARAVAQDAA